MPLLGSSISATSCRESFPQSHMSIDTRASAHSVAGLSQVSFKVDVSKRCACRDGRARSAAGKVLQLAARG